MVQFEDYFQQSSSLPGSVIDDLTLAKVVSENLQEGILIDVGCGNGLVSTYVALQQPKVSVLAVDIVYGNCLKTKQRAVHSELSHKLWIVCSNALQLQLPNADAICCNPPLLPDEIGFLQKQSSQVTLFWIALIEHISRLGCSHRLFLHLFDFHGVFESTSKWPCVKDVATKNKFNVYDMYHGFRIADSQSRIRTKLRVIAEFFPLGVIEVNGELMMLRETVDLDIDHRYSTIRIPHSIILLSK